MTAGKAIELCDQMRPNNDFADEMKQMWLRQCDARLRQTVVNRSAGGDFDAVGADMAALSNSLTMSSPTGRFRNWRMLRRVWRASKASIRTLLLSVLC